MIGRDGLWWSGRNVDMLNIKVKQDWVKQCMSNVIQGTGQRGRAKKTCDRFLKLLSYPENLELFLKQETTAF